MSMNVVFILGRTCAAHISAITVFMKTMDPLAGVQSVGSTIHGSDQGIRSLVSRVFLEKVTLEKARRVSPVRKG